MGKNIKSYATVPNSIFPPGKGGIPYSKKSKSSAKIQHGLTVHICFFVFKFTSKIFQIYILSFDKNFQQIIQILRNSLQNPANNAKFTQFIDPLYIMVSDA